MAAWSLNGILDDFWRVLKRIEDNLDGDFVDVVDVRPLIWLEFGYEVRLEHLLLVLLFLLVGFVDAVVETEILQLAFRLNLWPVAPVDLNASLDVGSPFCFILPYIYVRFTIHLLPVTLHLQLHWDLIEVVDDLLFTTE